MSSSKVGFKRSGFPQKKLIKIKDARGKVIAYEKVSRDFNAFKFLAGWFYLFPLWFVSSWNRFTQKRVNK
jgi:hypothetical protein